MFGVVLLTLGIGWFLQESGVWRMGWATLLSFVLIALGISLLATARTGHHRWLIAAGWLITAVLLSTASIDFDFPGAHGGMGDFAVRPRTLSALESRYQHRLGDVLIDLTVLPVPHPDNPVDIAAELGAGDLTVIVPGDVPIAVDAEVRLGSVTVLGSTLGDGGDFETTYTSESELGPAYRIRLRLGLGDLRVVAFDDDGLDLSGIDGHDRDEIRSDHTKLLSRDAALLARRTGGRRGCRWRHPPGGPAGAAQRPRRDGSAQ